MSTIANKLLGTTKNKFAPAWVDNGLYPAATASDLLDGNVLFDRDGTSPTTAGATGTDAYEAFDNNSSTVVTSSYAGASGTFYSTVARYVDPAGSSIRFSEMHINWAYSMYLNTGGASPSGRASVSIVPVAGLQSSVTPGTEIPLLSRSGLNLGHQTAASGDRTFTSSAQLDMSPAGGGNLFWDGQTIFDTTYNSPFYVVVQSKMQQSAAQAYGSYFKYIYLYNLSFGFETA